LEFDYVIVGGGSAGSVMAARLSEDPNTTVCLLEAGGKGDSLLVRAPMALLAMLPGWGKINNWAFHTVPQKALQNRRLYHPRGRALGGSSAINAMLYVRGHPSDYDDWAAAGATGWGWDAVLPYFRKSERNMVHGGGLHGQDGPLHVSDQQDPRPIAEAFIEAAEECQIPRNPDFNGPQQEGAGYYQVTQFSGGARNGERCSAAAAYIHPNLSRPNLKVLTKARGLRVLQSEGRATGVLARLPGGNRIISARREVILCGGAFHSPQLLMLSGIGPGAELQRQGIAVQHDLPGVGQNLQDHLDFILAYHANTTDLLGLGLQGAVNLTRHALEWRKSGSGMMATPGAESGAFLKVGDRDRPDVQLHFVPAIVENHARRLHVGYGYSCHACVLRPKSRGEVGLSSPDPMAAPRIDPRYLSHEDDAKDLLDAAIAMRQIMRAPAMVKYQTREIFTQGVADQDLMSHIRARAGTIYHPVGTCRMGTDSDAVTDPEGRVRGVDGLRVVDASLMPTLIGGNTNAPVIMMAEKIADGMRSAPA
jgi:choline dehydrogenase-like flavoprotein